MILDPKTVEDVMKNREEWATALESGTYQQGARRLKWHDGAVDLYCCLGVLSCLIDPSETSWNPVDSYPPTSILRTVGLRKALRDNESITDAVRLANANDGGKDDPQMPFPEIAQMIRALPLPEAVTA